MQQLNTQFIQLNSINIQKCIQLTLTPLIISNMSNIQYSRGTSNTFNLQENESINRLVSKVF